MAIVTGMPTYFPRRLSEYVPAMAYDHVVVHHTLVRISFGAPILALATAVLSAQSIATAGSTTTTLLANNTVDAPWGRNLTYVASGASTATVTVSGLDYLGQIVTEVVTLNGTTPVVGLKAIKVILSVTWTATGGTTMNIGVGARLGLPYKCIKVDHETSDGVVAAAGTLTAPVLTDPQTTSTGDPRGTYTTTTTLDGAKVITAVCHFVNDVNAAGNGGLHGIAHV